uniref:Ig-like domain-containing protein n=1 Tax=Trichuris muris TaxID=70415 RepID=A0A5S6R623_TRIMR
MNGSEQMSASFPSSTNPCGQVGDKSQTLPRKGILKQSASANQLETSRAISRDRSRSLSPSREVITSHDSGAPKPSVRQSKKSKIPKLSVTWGEMNPDPDQPDEEDRDRETAIISPIDHSSERENECPKEDRGKKEESEDVDGSEETHSQASASGSTISQWWQGRSTRYVLHCDKRGCTSHSHLHDEDYMTPTQRKNREMTQLRMRLRQKESELEDREAHLQQLRDRLTELETIMDRGGLLTENYRLSSKLAQLQESHKKEKRLLCDRFEQRFNQLRDYYESENVELKETHEFEMEELRTMAEDDSAAAAPSCGTKPSGIPKRKPGILMEPWESTGSAQAGVYGRKDVGVMTEDWEPSLIEELKAYHSECVFLQNYVMELQRQLASGEQANRVEKGEPLTVDVGGPSLEGGGGGGYSAMEAQIEAYKTECVIWRLKSSELEIALKEQIAARAKIEEQMEIIERDNESLEKLANQLKSQIAANLQEGSKLSNGAAATCSDKDICRQPIGQPEMPSEETPAVEAPQRNGGHSEGAVEEPREKPASQFDQTAWVPREKFDELRDQKHSLNAALVLLRGQFSLLEKDQSEKLEQLRLKDDMNRMLEKQLLAKQGEYETFQLSFLSLRQENEKLGGKIERLEQKIRSQEEMLDQCGVTVTPALDDQAVVGRAKATPTAQKVSRAREIQTDVPYADHQATMSQLLALKEEYDKLKELHDSESSQSNLKIAELGETLNAKNDLVANLTSQMQTLCDEFQALQEGFERERNCYAQQASQLGSMVQRIPYLEKELLRTRVDMRNAEEKAGSERLNFQRTLEQSLTENLRVQNETASFWRCKLAKLDKQLEEYKKRLEVKENELSEVNIRLGLEKANLAQQVRLSLTEVAEFQKRFNRPTANQKIMVQPTVCDQEVSCIVQRANVATEIQKDEFHVDASTETTKREEDHQVRLLKGELMTTRAQVNVLQNKLMKDDKKRAEMDELRELYNKMAEQNEDLQQELSISKAETKIAQENLTQRSQAWQAEKDQLLRAEKDRFLRLEKEFEMVREELKAMMSKHEKEKAELMAKLGRESTASAGRTTERSTSVPPEPTVNGGSTGPTIATSQDYFEWIKDVISGEAKSPITSEASKRKLEQTTNELERCTKERDTLRDQLDEQKALVRSLTGELILYKAEEGRVVRRLEEQLSATKHMSFTDLLSVSNIGADGCLLKSRRNSLILRHTLNDTCRQLVLLRQKFDQLEADRAKIRYELDVLKCDYEMVALRSEEDGRSTKTQTTVPTEPSTPELGRTGSKRLSIPIAVRKKRSSSCSSTMEKSSQTDADSPVLNSHSSGANWKAVSKTINQSVQEVTKLYSQIQAYYEQQSAHFKRPSKHRIGHMIEQLIEALRTANGRIVSAVSAEKSVEMSYQRQMDSLRQQLQMAEYNAAQLGREIEEFRIQQQRYFSARFDRLLSIPSRFETPMEDLSVAEGFSDGSPSPSGAKCVVAKVDEPANGGSSTQATWQRSKAIDDLATTSSKPSAAEDRMTKSLCEHRQSDPFEPMPLPSMANLSVTGESIAFYSCDSLNLSSEDVDYLQQLLQLERERFKTVEEKAAQLEKETSMLNFELGMMYRRQSRERELLKTENERLHKQVNELIDRLEKAATNRSPICVCGRRRRVSARSLSASARNSSSERASMSPMSRSHYVSRGD